jgi:dihydrofolate reductase
MGQLIADLFITLDGYASGEGAPAYFGYPGPELERWVDEHLAMPQVLLMGRVTYVALSAIAQIHPVEGPDRMSELPKVVFSRTLREPLAWDNSRLAKADLVEEVRRLKAESDAPLRTIGSLSVVKGLLEVRMVDRLRLTVFPLILEYSAARAGSRSSPDSPTSTWSWSTPKSSTPASSRSSIAPLPPSRRTKSKQPQALQPLKGAAHMGRGEFTFRQVIFGWPSARVARVVAFLWLIA